MTNKIYPLDSDKLSVGANFPALSFSFIRDYFQTLVRFLAEASH